MKIKRINIVLFIIAFALFGCKKSYIVSEGQKIFFQYDYINFTGEFQHHGIIIDNEGNVLAYDKPEKWNFPGKDNILTRAEVEENLSFCVPTGRQIPNKELQKYINFIDNISASKISAPRLKSSTMGSHIYYCFQYSEVNDTYKAVIIKQEGDIECENLNFYSKKIVEWMKEIQGISRK
ncbi:MAG TPA: hypothetical protein PLN06_08515 [Bacteroidales bacterium]|nr:hypothetical protein [Bacteroidales bacterium]HCI55249.1 hypothetical protein [Bacteroidales bacterium]HOU96649.1 hypothetical protein [Bacteroidales bacterium]HQG37208.1 hypothetical protein [Bacteroidales bacterium]HQG53252.1 hypothetical protein [Bacteroidales bacterium]